MPEINETPLLDQNGVDENPPILNAFGIFEGGGAKGIAHIGALQATNEAGIAFVGVAGTSAGAIIATLVAAGFSASEIFDRYKPEENILRRYKKTPVDLIGRNDWGRMKQISRLARHHFICSVLSGPLVRWLLSSRIRWATRQLLNNLGLFSTKELKEFVNICLHTKFQQNCMNAQVDYPLSAGEPIQFRHFRPGVIPETCALKIAATDIDAGKMVIFDSSNDVCANVPVADAVCASIAIPGAFAPENINGRYYVDGGLIANLPLWVFAEEKLALERDLPIREPIPILAFTLPERRFFSLQTRRETGLNITPLQKLLYHVFPPKNHSIKVFRFQRLCGFFIEVLKIGIFGGQAMVQKFVQDVHVFPLQTTLKTFDFDVGWPELQSAFFHGYLQTQPLLIRRFGAGKTAIVKSLEELHSQFKAFIYQEIAIVSEDFAASPLDELRKGQPLILRLSISRPFRSHSYRLTYTYNMNNYADDRLVIDHRNRGIPEAFDTRKISYIDIPAGGGGKFTKYEKCLIWEDLRSVIAVPIFQDAADWEKELAVDRNKPIAALCIDSNVSLRKFSENQSLTKALTLSSQLLYDTLNAYGAWQDYGPEDQHFPSSRSH